MFASFLKLSSVFVLKGLFDLQTSIEAYMSKFRLKHTYGLDKCFANVGSKAQWLQKKELVTSVLQLFAIE